MSPSARARAAVVVAFAVVGGVAGYLDEGVGLGIYMAVIFAAGAGLGLAVVRAVATNRRQKVSPHKER